MELEGIIMLTHIHIHTIKCKNKYNKKITSTLQHVVWKINCRKVWFENGEQRIEKMEKKQFNCCNDVHIIWFELGLGYIYI